MKRIIASFFLVGMFFSCSSASFAVDMQPFRASPTLSRYSAMAFAGDNSGEIIISFDVLASKPATALGVESIEFYTKSGDHVASVTGTTSNGLITNKGSIHGGDFVYDLPSGKSYYAEVTIFARAGSEYDSRTVTTSAVWIN